jgi:hypothetical protein
MAETMNQILRRIFKLLDQRIAEENAERRESGGNTISSSEVRILGQMSLLANKKVSSVLHLAQTGDMDALVSTVFAKLELKKILVENGLVYDEDSEKIWIPPGSSFEKLFEFPNVLVTVIDPESALVSKAVKAIEKNKFLLREALASGTFKNLLARIEKHGVDVRRLLDG